MGTASFADFLLLGFEHIFTGYDHLLFLFGLLIVCPRWPQLIAIITCFTIGHSLTLALATLGLVHLPATVSEPLIALTILFVGAENVLRKGESPRGRWMVTLLFGLIHGFGFANVLRDLGVGANGGSIALPLLGFNLGVELGQLLFAAVVLPVCWGLRTKPVFTERVVPILSVIIFLAGGYWLVERLLLA